MKLGIALCVVLAAGCILALALYFGVVEAYHPLKKARPGQIRVACVGDSITYGCMVGNQPKNSYPAVLSSLLGQPYCVNNFGYSDRTATKDADRPYTRERLYQQSLDFQPDIVLVLLGANDTKAHNWNPEKFVRDYGKIIDSYAGLASSPKIYILSPLPMFKMGKKVLWRLQKDIAENQLRVLTKAIARDRSLEYLDVGAVFAGRKDLFADGVHPNRKGSRVLAEAVWKALGQYRGKAELQT